jgi:hypothetical protein
MITHRIFDLSAFAELPPLMIRPHQHLDHELAKALSQQQDPYVLLRQPRLSSVESEVLVQSMREEGQPIRKITFVAKRDGPRVVPWAAVRWEHFDGPWPSRTHKLEIQGVRREQPLYEVTVHDATYAQLLRVNDLLHGAHKGGPRQLRVFVRLRPKEEGFGRSVYICAPFEGGPDSHNVNIDRARRVSHAIADLATLPQHEAQVITPHTMWSHIPNYGRARSMIGCRHMVNMTQGLIVVGKHITGGMVEEICLKTNANLVFWIPDAERFIESSNRWLEENGNRG